MFPGLHHLLGRWRADPRPATTLALCHALSEYGEEKRRNARDAPDEWAQFVSVVAEVGEMGMRDYQRDIDVMSALGRMFLASGSVLEAQAAALVAARISPVDPGPYRLLGEALLRRGDAVRAAKALHRAVDGGMDDPRTRVWLDRARFYVKMQSSRGQDAVRDEIRRVLGSPPSVAPPSNARLTVPPGMLADAPFEKPQPMGVDVPSPRAPNSDPPSRRRGPRLETLRGVPTAAARFSPPPVPAELAGLDPEGPTESDDSDQMITKINEPDDDIPTRKREALTPEELKQLTGKQQTDLMDPRAVPNAGTTQSRPQEPSPSPSVRPFEAKPEGSGEDEMVTQVAAVPPPGPAPPPSPRSPLEFQRPKTNPSRARDAVAVLKDSISKQNMTPVDRLRRALGVERPDDRDPDRYRPVGDDPDSEVVTMKAAPPKPAPAFSGGENQDHSPLSATGPLPTPGQSALAVSANLLPDADAPPPPPKVASPSAPPMGGGRPRSNPPPSAPPLSPRAPSSSPPAAPPSAPSAPSVSSRAASSPPTDLPYKATQPLPVFGSLELPIRPLPNLVDDSQVREAKEVGAETGADPAVRSAETKIDGKSPVRPAAPANIKSPARKSSRRLMLGIIGVGVIAAGAVVGQWQYRKHLNAQRANASAMATQAEALLRTGTPSKLEEAQALIEEALAEDPTNASVVRVAVLLDSISLLEVASDEGRAIALTRRIRSLGAERLELRIATVVAATGLGNAKLARELVEGYDQDETTLGDPYYQLAAGAALELSGDDAAVERYARAFELAHDLSTAELRLARALLLYGDRDKGVTQAQAVEERESLQGRVLTSLGRKLGGEPDDAPPLSDEEIASLPRSLRAIARVLIGSAEVSGAQGAQLLSDVDSPAVGVLVGETLLAASANALAEQAAKRAAASAPSYGPAVTLKAMLDFGAGRFEEGIRSAERLPLAKGALVLAIAAYEQGDLTKILSLRDGAKESAVTPAAAIFIGAAQGRLRGKRPLSAETLEQLRVDVPAWAELVSVDAALDLGDLAAARAVVSRWDKPQAHPLRAFRLARLLRNEGKFAEATEAILKAHPTRPALREAVLIAAEDKDARADAQKSMDPRLGEDLPWLSAYLYGRDRKYARARTIMSDLKIPEDADLDLRVIASLALGEAGDRVRGRPLVRELLKAFPNRWDVVRAAVLLGERSPAALASFPK